MSTITFLDLPFELRESIYATYAESVDIKFIYNRGPWEDLYGRKKELQYEWFIGLANPHTGRHGMPALLLTSKDIYREFLIHLGTHKPFCIPDWYPYIRGPDLAPDLVSELSWYYRSNLQHIVFTCIAFVPKFLAGERLGLDDMPQCTNKMRSLTGVLPALRRITICMEDSIDAEYYEPDLCATLPKDPDQDACKVVALKWARQQFAELEGAMSQSLPIGRQNIRISLNLRLHVSHEGFCCIGGGSTTWTILVSEDPRPTKPWIITLEKVKPPTWYR